MNLSTVVWLATFCALCARFISAFPSGAPVSACNTLSPSPVGHLVGPTDCPGDPCTFFIRVDVDLESGTYSCGQVIPLLVTSTNQTTFRGFFTQSRETTDTFQSSAPFVGEFVEPIDPDAESQIRPCSGSNAGATHVSRSDKNSVTLLWRAPDPGEPAPNVTFWLTIVQVRVLYHVQISALTLMPDQQSCQVLQVAEFVNDTLPAPEEVTPLLVCVRLLLPAEEDEDITLIVAPIDRQTDTATTGEDYRLLQTTIVFPAGSAPGAIDCVEVEITDDENAEGNEVFTLGLVSESQGLGIDEITITIIDNDDEDQVVRLEFVNDTIMTTEGVALSVCARILDSPSEFVVAILDAISDTANEGADYEITLGSIVFSPGVPAGSTGCFVVQIISDQNNNEIAESFRLFLLRNDEIMDELRVTIVGDAILEDPVVGFQNLEYSISEGETLTACVLVLSGGSIFPFSVQMVSVSGTAEVGPDGDAERILTIVQFQEGSVAGDTECVQVSIFEDSLVEPTEFFFLGLFTRFGTTIDPDRRVAVVNILDRVEVETVASVGFTEVFRSLAEDVGPTLACIQFTTASGFPLEEDVAVYIQSSDDSAVSFPIGLDPPDYLSVNTTINILSGTPSGTTFCTSVSIVDDGVLENEERFFLYLGSLSPLVAVEEGLGTQAVYIIDNEARVSVFRVVDTYITTDEGTIAEPNAGITVEITLEMVSDGPLLENVYFILVPRNGSAFEFEDFYVPQAYIHFEVGSRGGQQATALVNITDDQVAEAFEEFSIYIISTDETVAVIKGDSTVTISIVDDDVLYVGLVPTFMEVNEADGEVFACVQVFETYPGPVIRDLTVRIGTQDDTAVAMEDYVRQNTELTFPPGTQEGDVQCLGIPLIDNNIADGARRFTVSIVSFDPLVRVIPPLSQKEVYIEDNDGTQVKFERSDYQVAENAEVVWVCVVLVGKTLNESGTISVRTQDGSATAGSDYTETVRTFQFAAGSGNGTSYCFPIPITDDGIAEISQSFYVLLTSLSTDVFTVADGGDKTTVTIIDDEVTGLPVVVFSETEINVLENTVQPPLACISLSDGSLGGQGASFNIVSSPGTATAGADYTPVSTTLTLPAFAPSGTLSCITLNILDDEEMEEREYFSLRLENLSPDIVTVNEGGDILRVLILDDDSPMAVVGFQVIESAVNESVGNKFTCIEIISGGPLLFDSVIRFYTQDDTAVAPDDYSAVDVTLTFREGANGSRPSDAVCVDVPIVDDSDLEGTERLTFRIEAVDQDRITVYEPLAEKVLYILDNDAVRVGFERTMYEVSEGIDPDLGLLACVTVEDAPFPFQLVTDAVGDTATEILDFRVNNSPLQFIAAGGNQTQCAYVQVVNDGLIEGTEYFTLELSTDEPAIVVTTPSALIRIIDIDEPIITTMPPM